MDRPHYKLKKRLHRIEGEAEKLTHILIDDANRCEFGTEAARIAIKNLSEIQKLADQAYWAIDKDRERVIEAAKNA